MNTKDKQEIPFRERFDGFTVNPSPGVWQKIEAAKPAPVAKPGIRWIAFTGAAALIVVALWWVLRQEAQESTSVPTAQNSEHKQSPETDAARQTVQPKGNPAGKPSSGSQTAVQQSSVAANPATSGQTQTLPLQPAAGNSAGPSSIHPNSSTTTPGPIPAKIAENAVKTLPETKPSPRLPERTPAKIVASDPVNDSTGGNTGNTRLEIFIPNAFAPGTNGPNCLFKPVIKNNAPVKEYKMQIFSRAGLLLFESDDVETGWDGRFGGDIVNDQVCAYIITFRDEAGFPYARKGTITLVR